MCQCTWYTIIFTLALFCALWCIACKMGKYSLEKKFTSMKMRDLKRFLQDRGVSVNSQLKPRLVAIACAVESMKLPLKNRVTVEEEKQNFRVFYILKMRRKTFLLGHAQICILIYLYAGITDIYSYIFTTFYCRYWVRVFHRSSIFIDKM